MDVTRRFQQATTCYGYYTTPCLFCQWPDTVPAKNFLYGEKPVTGWK